MTRESLNAVDELIEKWPRLSKSERFASFRGLPRSQMEDLFLSVSARSQSRLVQALPEEEQRSFIRLLAPDDAADLVQETPAKAAGTLPGTDGRHDTAGRESPSRVPGRCRRRPDEPALCSAPARSVDR